MITRRVEIEQAQRSFLVESLVVVAVSNKNDGQVDKIAMTSRPKQHPRR